MTAPGVNLFLRHGWDFFFTVGISSTDLGALRSGEFFTVGIFSWLGFPPPISALSDRGSIFTVGIFSQLGFPPPILALLGFFRGWVLALSDRGSIFTVGIFHGWNGISQLAFFTVGKYFTVGIFSQLGFPPPISALSDRGSIFTVGIFHSWDFLHQSDIFTGLF